MWQNKKFISKCWGYEEHLTEPNAQYFGKKLFIANGHFTSWHYHRYKDEVFYVLDGVLTVRYSPDDLIVETSNGTNVRISKAELVELQPGDSFRMKPLIRHRLFSYSGHGVNLIEFSNSHIDDSDTVRLVNGY